MTQQFHDDTPDPFMEDSTERERVEAALGIVFDRLEQEFASDEFRQGRESSYSRPINFFAEDIRWPNPFGLRGMAQEVAGELLSDHNERILLEVNLGLYVSEAFSSAPQQGVLSEQESATLTAALDEMLDDDYDDDMFMDFVNGLPDPLILATVQQASRLYSAAGSRLQFC